MKSIWTRQEKIDLMIDDEQQLSGGQSYDYNDMNYYKINRLKRMGWHIRNKRCSFVQMNRNQFLCHKIIENRWLKWKISMVMIKNSTR